MTDCDKKDPIPSSSTSSDVKERDDDEHEQQSTNAVDASKSKDCTSTPSSSSVTPSEVTKEEKEEKDDDDHKNPTGWSPPGSFSAAQSRFDINTLDKKNKSTFLAYQQASAIDPPDLSLKDNDNHIQTQWLFREYRKVCDPMTYGKFYIGGWEVYDILKKWVQTGKAIIPRRLSRVLVPFEQYECGKAKMLFKRKMTGSPINCGYDLSSRTVFCRAKCEEDRAFYGSNPSVFRAEESFASVDKNSLVDYQYLELDKVLTAKEVDVVEFDVLRNRIIHEKRKNRLFRRILDFMYHEQYYYIYPIPLPDCYVLPMGDNEDDFSSQRASARDRAKEDVEKQAADRWARLQKTKENCTYSDMEVVFDKEEPKSTIVYYPMYSGEIFVPTKDGEKTAYRIAVNGLTGEVIGEQPKSKKK